MHRLSPGGADRVTSRILPDVIGRDQQMGGGGQGMRGPGMVASQTGMAGPQGTTAGPQGALVGPQGGTAGPKTGMNAPPSGMTGPQVGMYGPQGMAGPQGGMLASQGVVVGVAGGMVGTQEGEEVHRKGGMGAKVGGPRKVSPSAGAPVVAMLEETSTRHGKKRTRATWTALWETEERVQLEQVRTRLLMEALKVTYDLNADGESYVLCNGDRLQNFKCPGLNNVKCPFRMRWRITSTRGSAIQHLHMHNHIAPGCQSPDVKTVAQAAVQQHIKEGGKRSSLGHDLRDMRESGSTIVSSERRNTTPDPALNSTKVAGGNNPVPTERLSYEQIYANPPTAKFAGPQPQKDDGTDAVSSKQKGNEEEEQHPDKPQDNQPGKKEVETAKEAADAVEFGKTAFPPLMDGRPTPRWPMFRNMWHVVRKIFRIRRL